MQKYVLHKGKKLRYGFTTGSAAAAATKAACLYLKNKQVEKNILIITPNNETLNIKIHTCFYKNNSAFASVLKDGGDDIDITNGMEICAKVTKITKSKLIIKGGEGVGVVTKKGLAVEVGKAAINPTPYLMIKKSVLEVFDISKEGIEVEIFAPQGKEIAKRTLNSKLGIINGISILGSTGIVKPMSEEAFKDSLALELKAMKIQEKSDEFVFTFGNYGEKYAVNKLNFEKEKIIIISNFVGFMLEKACEFGVKKIFLVGNIGKIVKVAGGIFHTHSKVSDARLEILAANALKANEPIELVKNILNSNTTEEAVSLMKSFKTFEIMANKIREKCEAFVKRSGFNLEVAVLIYSNEYGTLANTKNFKKVKKNV